MTPTGAGGGEPRGKDLHHLNLARPACRARLFVVDRNAFRAVEVIVSSSTFSVTTTGIHLNVYLQRRLFSDPIKKMMLYLPPLSLIKHFRVCLKRFATIVVCVSPNM